MAWCYTLALAILLWGAGSRARGADRPLDFIHALQEAGYGDTAVEYMQTLEQRKEVPQDLKEVWDLEMSQSYDARAKNAFDDREATTSRAEAKKYLDKFLKENPDHPEAAKAVLNSAKEAEQTGLLLIRAAKLETNKEQAAEDLKQARAAFEDAKPRFLQALKRFEDKLRALPDPAKGTKKEKDEYERAHYEYLEARFQVALLNVYIARTIADPKDAERIKMLHTASQEFDEIFQFHRSDVFGLASHMWQGMAEDELGNIDKALDITEEVLAYGPDPKTATPATLVDSVFAEVEYEHLQLLKKKKRDEDFYNEAKEWLEGFKKNKKNVQLNYFQGIALEFVRASLAAAETATGPGKLRLINEAQATLNEIVRTPSDFQKEAILLKRSQGKGNTNEEPKSMDEAVAVADTSLASGQWEDGIKYYQKALELAPKNADPARLAAIKAALNKARFNIARDLYTKEKFAECLVASEKIAHDADAGDVAAFASSMSVQAAFSLYLHAATEADKDQALERMNQDAEYTIATWPGKPEADDARMLLGQASLVIGKGKIDEALKAFKSVNIKSEKYPLGMYFAGRTYWIRYLDEKKKPAAQRNTEQMAADRTAAVDYLNKSIDAQKKLADPAKPPAKQYLDAELLLGEILLEQGQSADAIAHLQPLVDLYVANKPEQFDATMRRVFLSTIMAYAGQNDLTKATEVGLKLLEIGPDTKEVNLGLMEVAKMLDLELKKAQAAVITNDNGANQKKLADTKKMLSDIMGKLKDRTQLSAASLVFIADVFASLDDVDSATAQYTKLLDIIEKEPDSEIGRALIKAKARIRSQVIGLKRKKGDFAGALTEVDTLIQDNKGALEPRLEKCRILQARAEKNKNPQDFEEAVKGWNDLGDMLRRSKPRPDEYYEVLYNTANCLMLEAEKTKATDKSAAAAKALSAEKLLNSVLLTPPRSVGPDLLARYQSLANQAAVLQGRAPAEKK
ncbi:MAG TPA: hypothetical protein VFE24_08070 [Pirellulales bacterium]|jgi:tetratricopeptide (TPR) repeat protein|nr:hypothetical protein [Pirellulales bacterium]